MTNSLDTDWGHSNLEVNKAEDIDWGTPVTPRVRFEDELELDLKLGGDSDEEENSEDEGKVRWRLEVRTDCRRCIVRLGICEK